MSESFRRVWWGALVDLQVSAVKVLSQPIFGSLSRNLTVPSVLNEREVYVLSADKLVPAFSTMMTSRAYCFLLNETAKVRC